MKFSELSIYLQRLEKTPSRNEITDILAELFKKANIEEIDKIVYLVLGELAPNYKGIVLNIAEKMMLRAISEAYKIDPQKALKSFKKSGDLGNIAEEYSKKNNSELSVSEVFDHLMSVAQDSGAGSQDRKVGAMAKLLTNLDGLSARYVARIPVGKLRLGFSDMTILDALSVMLKGDKSARREIESAFNVTVDIGKIVKKIKQGGLAAIKSIKPEPGTPIRPSLCERLPSAEKILEKVGERVFVEPKYDGFRSQIHVWTEKGEKLVAIYSRNLELTTAMFPDLVESVKKINVESIILDSEAIGYDTKNDKFLPFQETIQRKRKHGIDEAAKSFPLRIFAFDILYLNGKNLMDTPFIERRKILNESIKENEGLKITRQELVTDPDRIRDLVAKYLSEGLEGAVIKKVDAPYMAGGRGYHWVKYKKNTVKGLADTIDCLVMGVNRGKGKRAGFGVGGFLVGVLDGGHFKSVTKIGTGLSDEQWKELDLRSKKLEVEVKPNEYDVDKTLYPDAWMKPSLVVEILADEITVSPIHKAGLALRFPRLIKFRDEKEASDTTTLKELQKLFEMQKVMSKS